MPTFDGFEFAKRLKVARINAAFDRQEDLADAIDVSSQSISFYERGRRLPDAKILSKLAEALNCSADYLLQIESATSHEKTDIVNQTGLSQRAVDVLCEMRKNQSELNKTYDRIELDALSTLISSETIHEFLRVLFFYLFDNRFEIFLNIDGKIRISSLNEVIAISCTDPNHAANHGVFRETIEQALETNNAIQLQRILVNLREDVRKGCTPIEDDSKTLAERNATLARHRDEIHEELKLYGQH